MNSRSVNIDALDAICASVIPAETPIGLMQTINDTLPGQPFHYIFTDNDWYRVGGIVTSDGARLADSLEDWLGAHFSGDIADFAARFGRSGYRVTNVRGKTHYFSASMGDAALDFVQVEVEEVDEVVSHDLIDAQHIPDSIETIIDPLDPSPVEAVPVTPPRYQCKRITNFSDLAEDLISDFSGDRNFRRFLDEWQRSTASDHVAFHDCWAVTVVPLLRAVSEHKTKVRLLSRFADRIHAYDMSGRGAAGHILNMIASVDRECGFPMAWYFLLVTKKYMSHALAASIRQELGWKRQPYITFADADREIFEAWIDNPYWL